MRSTAAARDRLTDLSIVAIMSHPAVVIHDYDTLAEALRAYAVAGLRHLGVIDASGRCVGLLPDRAIAAAWVRHPMLFDQLTVGQFLEESQPILPRDATIGQAARLMHHCGTDAVVVVDAEDEPIGVLTAGDLVALLAKPPVSADALRKPSASDEDT
jgi:CBS domain-containing protein